MKKLDKSSWAAIVVSGLAIGSFGGAGIFFVIQEGEASEKPAVYTTLCVAGQNRVIESNKTREFHVMWDETCPK